jgi:hypothetical protein
MQGNPDFGGRVNEIELTNESKMQKKNELDDTYWTEYDRNEHEAEKAQNADTESQIVDSFSIINIDRHDYERHRDGIDSDYDVDEIEDSKLKMPKIPFNFLIIDCSPINFVDTVGVKTMKQVNLVTLVTFICCNN